MDRVGENGAAAKALLHDSPDHIGSAARRILESEGLRRSGKLRELLSYLLNRAAVCPDSPVREQNIGAEVYGRSPDYDTNHDTVVRVQIAQLRKKLERYYQTEGAHDELILTIPKGRYVALWRPRVTEIIVPSEAVPKAAMPQPTTGPPAGNKVLARVLGGLCAILVVVITMMVFGFRRVPPDNQTIHQSSALTSLWSQILLPGKTTHVVLSDPGLVMLSRATGRRIRYSDLGDQPFWGPLEAMNAPSEYKTFLRGATSSQLTTISDLELIRSITELNIVDPESLNIMPARDFRIRDLNDSNSILIGYSLSNPWVEVFSETINFVLNLEPSSGALSITNLHPNRGEPDKYRLGDPRTTNPSQGFATVALLPNPAHSGNVLIISGADVPGTEAAIRFLTTKTSWDPFYRRMVINGHLAPFEVVLAYHRLSKSFGDVTPVAFRMH
jgi:hypothetical protein